MKTIIAGPRDVPAELAKELVVMAIRASEFGHLITEIIHGGATGIDTAAAIVCKANWPVTAVLADWRTHGKAAGPIRNRQMARMADALIAIWDGKSKGTRNMIDVAKAAGLRAEVVMFERGEG